MQIDFHTLTRMGKGRGSAVVAVAVLCLVVAALRCEIAQAATYTVGGPGGWTFNVSGWPRGKRFNAGDVLVFNYNRGIHNVAAVNKAGYDNCSNTPRNSRVYRTGNDQIKLSKGFNFFICTIPGHCGAGMKIQINAT